MNSSAESVLPDRVAGPHAQGAPLPSLTPVMAPVWGEGQSCLLPVEAPLWSEKAPHSVPVRKVLGLTV